MTSAAERYRPNAQNAGFAQAAAQIAPNQAPDAETQKKAALAFEAIKKILTSELDAFNARAAKQLQLAPGPDVATVLIKEKATGEMKGSIIFKKSNIMKFVNPERLKKIDSLTGTQAATFNYLLEATTNKLINENWLLAIMAHGCESNIKYLKESTFIKSIVIQAMGIK